jgi:hypothetical protein
VALLRNGVPRNLRTADDLARIFVSVFPFEYEMKPQSLLDLLPGMLIQSHRIARAYSVCKTRLIFQIEGLFNIGYTLLKFESGFLDFLE